MRAKTAIVIILISVASTVAGYLISANHATAAFVFLVVFFTLCGIAVILVSINDARPSRPSKTALQKPTREETKPQGKLRFGVYWDADLNPLCPSCGMPLTLSTEKLTYSIGPNIPPPKPILHCMKCGKALPLYDDHGNSITLAEAKQLLSPTIQLQTADPPQLLQAPQRSEPTEYEPDKTAIQVLVKIEQGVCHESELARELKLEPSQVNNSLRLLEQHDYVRLVRPEGHGHYYQITQKGIDRLNRPNYKVPPPSGNLDPVLENILRLLAKPNFLPYAEEVARYLDISEQRSLLYLSKLEKKGLIHSTYFYTGQPTAYSLTDEGRQYLDDRDML